MLVPRALCTTGARARMHDELSFVSRSLLLSLSLKLSLKPNFIRRSSSNHGQSVNNLRCSRARYLMAIFAA